MISKIRKSLGIKIILVFSAVVILSGIFLNLYFLNDLQKAIKSQIVQYFSIIIDGKKNGFDFILENVRTRTADWSSDGYIRNTTESIINASDNNVRNQLVQALGSYLKNKKMPLDSSVMIADIMDKNGNIIVSSEVGRIGGAENDKLEKLPEKFGESFLGFGTIAEKEMNSAPMVYAAARIFNTKDTFAPLDAFLLLHFAKDQEMTSLLSNKSSTSYSYQTIRTYLINSDKFIVALSRSGDQPVLSRKIDNELTNVCLQNNEDIMQREYRDYSSNSVLGFSKCLRDYKLILLIEIQKQEIFSYLDGVVKRMWLMLVLAEIFGVFIIFAFSKLLLFNFNKVLASARKIASGDFNVRAESGFQDEVGDLARTINMIMDAVVDSQKQLREAKRNLQEYYSLLEKSSEGKSEEIRKIKDNLEFEVDFRTKELQDKINELEKFKSLAVGRELKMIELKEEIIRLKKEHEQYGR